MLSLQDVHITIEKTTICRGLTLKACLGEIWGIRGRNGAGKTTLLHGLAGLIKPTQGDITLQGKSLLTYTPRALAQSLGLLLQENESIFPLRVKDAVEMGRYPHLSPFTRFTQQDQHMTEHALTVMELQNLKKRFVQTLSGGEKRRCSIATLLAQAPCVYLLDEPLNHLDSIYQHRVMEHFASLARDKKALVMMVLHDSVMIEKYCSHMLTFPL